MKKLPQTRPFINFKINTVYKKLVWMTLLCSLLPLLISGSLSYCASYSISKSKTIASIQAGNQQVALHIANRLNQVERLSDSISYQLYTLYQTPEEPISEYLNTYSNAKVNIESARNIFNVFHITAFLPENSFITPQKNGITFFPLQKVADYGISQEELYRTDARTIWKLNIRQQFPTAFSQTPETVLTYWNSYRNINNGSLNYAFACHIKVSEFEAMLRPAINSDSSSCFLLGKDNIILLHPDTDKLGTVFDMPDISLWDKSSFTVIYEDQLLVAEPLMDSTMLLVTSVPTAYLKENGDYILRISFLATLYILLFAVACTVFVSKTFTKRINALAQVMQLGKEFPVQKALDILTPMISLPESRKDEIDHLISAYLSLTMENEEYFQKILDINLQTEKLKYQLLQSQINPHFLFNTLNSIIACQSLGKVQLAQEAASNLAAFYRHILRDPDHLITLGEELKITELYLKLISISKSNPISWDFRFDEGAENFLVCKFVLQPFVENSVLHGISSSSQPLHIRISIEYEEESILIRISDNGIGISRENLLEIRDTLKSNTINYDRHFGIANVNVRMTPYFSPQYPYIIIESQQGCGTDIAIHIRPIL